jgi:lipopolysaccharide export system protein LptA
MMTATPAPPRQSVAQTTVLLAVLLLVAASARAEAPGTPAAPATEAPAAAAPSGKPAKPPKPPKNATAAPAGAVAPAAPAPGAAGANSGPNLPGGAGSKKLPVDVQADNAIEWHQDEKAYVARGNASAVRGTTTVYADVLTAYYRESKDKGTDVYRMTAEGNVHVVSPSQQIFGEHGVYDNDKQFGVMTGAGLKLVTQTDVVTARDSLEYYDNTKISVARGEAIAVRNLNRMRADTLVAQFKEDANGNLVMDRLDGIGNVLITTPTDVALCDRVMYSVNTDIAVLVGDVKITRGDDQVNGDAAEMNMKTHVNRVMSGGRRVEGLLTPQPADQDQTQKPGAGTKGGKADTAGKNAKTAATASGSPPAPATATPAPPTAAVTPAPAPPTPTAPSPAASPSGTY